MTTQDQNQETIQAQVTVLAQYLHDLSFESPNSPQIFKATNAAPAIDMGINVKTRMVEAGQFEVLLMVKLEAKIEEKTAFIAEIAYGGLFAISALPEEQLKIFLLVEAPKLLFPFARGILATAVRDGGFPQVLINPIDFVSLYVQQQEQMAKAPAQGNA